MVLPDDLADRVCHLHDARPLPRRAEQDGASIEAGLADLPTVSDDGTTYVLPLRDGIKFKGGAPITGADIKYTFERMLNPAMASPGGRIFTAIDGAAAYVPVRPSRLRHPWDGNMVTYKLTDPPESFLDRLTMPFSCPVPTGPRSAIEDGSILGTGPYIVKSYKPQRGLALVRNPDYAADVLGDRGALDKITIDTTIDPTQAAFVIRSGPIATYMDLIAAGDAGQALADNSLEGRVFADTIAAVAYSVSTRRNRRSTTSRFARRSISPSAGRISSASWVAPPRRPSRIRSCRPRWRA